MAILKNPNKERFTVIDNDVFRKSKLTLKGMGMLCFLLSLPDNWDFSERGLAKLFPDGLRSVKTALRELEEKGYLTREQGRGEKGGFGKMIYTIREIPQTLENTEFDVRFKNESTPKELARKVTQINTNLKNTNLNNKSINQSKNIVSQYNDINYYKEEISKNINMWAIIQDNQNKSEMITEIISIMADVLSSNSVYTKLSKNKKVLTSDIKNVILNLTQGQFIYLLECISSNKNPITDIYSYILTSIYNTPKTMNLHYYSKATAEGSI